MKKKFGAFSYLPLFYMSPVDPGGGGGSEDDDEFEDLPAKSKKTAAVIIAKYKNDAQEMANHIIDVEDDNFKLRQKVRNMKDLLPKEGSRVLDAKESALFDEYVALGAPKDLAGLQAAVDTFKRENAEIKRLDLIRTVSDSVEEGVKFDFEVFKDLEKQLPGIEYELREIKNEETDEMEKKYYAKYKDNDVVKESSVLELAKSRWPKYLNSLIISSSENAQQTPFGAEYPEQIEFGKSKPKSDLNKVSSNIVKSQYGSNIPKQ